jgi:hypothetical protein
VLSISSLASGLLAGESALQIVPYFLAYELFRSPAPARGVGGRVLRMVTSPAFAVSILYLAIHRLLGFGSRGASIYLDPISQPKQVAMNALALAPRVGAEFLLAGTGVRRLLPALSAGPWAHAATLGALALFATTLGAWWRTSNEAETSAPSPRSTLAWLLVGGAGSMFPIFFLPAPAADAPLGIVVRIFVLPTLGFSAALGTVVAFAFSARSRSFAAFLRPLFLAGALVGASQVILGPAGVAQLLMMYGRNMEAPPLAVADQGIPGEARRVVVLTTDRPTDYSLWLRLKLLGRPSGLEALWLLSITPGECKVTRLSDRSLLLEPKNSLFPPAVRQIDPATTGREFPLRDLRIQILEAHDGAVKRARFDFDRSLDASELSFFARRNGKLSAVTLPAIGESITIAAGSLAKAK